LSSYYSVEELAQLGFNVFGQEVHISRKASFYGAQRISIGSHVRIDDFCIISAGEGGVTIGNYIHIAAYSSIIGGGEVSLEDFVNISSRVSIYSSNDDYSGAVMTGPMVPTNWTNIAKASVVIKRHVIIGCGSVILPGITIGEGVAIGALSLVKADCKPFEIYCGTPARFVGTRQQTLLACEREFYLANESVMNEPNNNKSAV
jgi:dTDP-4-amino-4,6-dideoxy-D-glucose acyltransferase